MAGEVRVPVFVSLKDEATQKLQAQLSGLSKSFGNFGSIISKTIGGVASFGAAIGAANFIGGAIDQAKNLERSLLSVNTVFGAYASQIESFAASSAKFGLSQSEAAKASVFLGSVLKQSGFDMGTTVEQTQKLVKLGADLSATYGYDVQEALLGMTALFRGEYDPIEKFGVAMKQSEINSELAARGLENLEGSERRLAEQQIRLQLLFERSADAQGAMERGSGSLYVQTEKLRAGFENLQANLGAQLVPVLAELFTKLQPIVEDLGPALAEIFTAIANAISFLAQVITDMFNPLSNVGDSFIEVGIAAESLLNTIFGFEDTEQALQGFKEFLSFIFDLIRNIINVVENLVIGFKVLADMAYAFFTGDWSRLANTDWTKQIQSQIAIKDAVKEQTLAVAKLNKEISNQKTVLDKANTAWSNSWIARGNYFGVGQGTSTTTGGGGGGGGGESQFDKVRKIIKDAQADLLKAERDYNRKKFEINRAYEDDVAKLREQAAKDQEDLFKESAKRLTDIFANASKTSLGDLFGSETTKELETRITKLTDRLSVSVTREVSKTTNSSVEELIKSLNDRIAASRALITNASTLASKGFSQTFIEEVVGTGTETGNALASAILNASPEMQDSLKTAFLDLETVSESGMDSVAKTLTDKFGLATRELNTQSKIIQEQLNADILEKQRTLATALADAAYAFGISVNDIRTEFEGVLDGLNGKFAGLDKTIDALLAKMGRLSGVALTDTQAALVGEGGSLAGATVSDVEVVKNAFTASGLVVDSASDLASSMAYVQARIAAAEKYIKSSSSGAAQEASAAASIASWTNELTKLAGATGAGAAGTVVNINVKTDTSQSVAMVGKTLGNIVTKYVTTGGQVLVSGTK